jgi:C-terminal processing protease CtpA/Prc
MTDTKSNAEILRNANVRLCRLRIWSNYKGLGFHLGQCHRPPHIITLVDSNSPASAGGLKISDVLLAINNNNVTKTDYNEVTIILKDAQDQHCLVELLVVEQHFYKTLKKNNIIIDSSLTTIFHTPIRMPDDYFNFPEHIPRICHIQLRSNDTHFGFDVVNGNNDIGIYIQEVLPGSRASSSGLRKCDRIIEIDDKYVDKDMSRDIWDKLGKALIRRTIKLLVVDTETYGYYVLNNLGKERKFSRT